MWRISLSLLLTFASALDWSSLDTLINEAITEHAFPGASVTVANDKQILFRGNYGHLTYKHQIWQVPVTNNTKYDVASITKVMATSLNLMSMLSSNSIQLNDLVSKYVDNYDTNKKGNTTIGHLLLHSAGLPYDYPGANLPDNQTQFFDYIRFIKPIYPIGTAEQYSNLGFYLLGKIIQKVTKKSFNQYFSQNKVFAGFNNSNFNPTAAQLPNIAPCQFDTEIRHRIVRGQAHQRVAYKYGGVAGHSGLFTTADDLTRYMRILLNKGKLPQTTRFLPQAIVQKFITKVQGLPYNNTRAYGFDTVCPGSKMKNCFRHDGSTGILSAADKTNNVIITVMCNRGHPDAKNTKVEQYKGKIANTVMTILGH